MKTIHIEKTKGYSGKAAGKTWVAKITADGREFLTADEIDYGTGREWLRREKATRIDTFHLTDGLYEVCEIGERYFRLVWTKDDGSTGSMALDDDRAARMVALINSGDDFDEAREKSKTKNFSA
jgi:hypothetical protein